MREREREVAFVCLTSGSSFRRVSGVNNQRRGESRELSDGREESVDSREVYTYSSAGHARVIDFPGKSGSRRSHGSAFMIHALLFSAARDFLTRRGSSGDGGRYFRSRQVATKRYTGVGRRLRA